MLPVQVERQTADTDSHSYEGKQRDPDRLAGYESALREIGYRRVPASLGQARCCERARRGSGRELLAYRQRSAIVWDALGEVHRMVVPQLAPGETELVVPKPGGGGELRARFRVLAPEYAGGSPAAALAEMNLLADSLQIQAIVAQRYVSPQADSILFPRLDALIDIAETTQQRVAALSAQDAAILAAFYTENAEMMRELTGMLTAMIGEPVYVELRRRLT